MSMKKPKIRFKGYTEDWEQRKLGEVAASFEYGLNAAAKEYDDENKYIRITDIDDNTHEFLTDSLTSPDIDLTGADNYKLTEGDILFARTGASVGKSYIYRNSDGLVYYAGFLIRARIKEEYDAEFVFQNTLTDRYNKYIAVTSQRSGQPGVNAQEYAEFEIKVPKKEEQTKIGAYFKQLDHLITLHQRKCNQAKKLKKYMLQKMFPQNGEKIPEIRFDGFTDDWEQRKLGDIADVTKLAGFEFTEHVVYSDEGNIIALRGLNIKNGQLILDDVKYIDGSNFSKLSRSKLFIDDIMFTYVGTVGEVAIIKENDRFYLAPNVSRIRVKSDDSPKFISHYMRTDNFKNKVIFPLIATSSQPALSMENIRKFTINIPISREEQDCLAKYFDNLDQLITLHQRKCDEMKKIKKFMLQNMFV